MKGGVLLGEEDYIAVPLYGGPYGGEFRGVPKAVADDPIVEFGVTFEDGTASESAFYAWEHRPVLVYLGGGTHERKY